MRHNRSTLFAWLAFGTITAVAIATFFSKVIDGNHGDGLLRLINDATSGLVVVIFALVGALIVSHQPRNAIGLLLLLPALVWVIPVDSYLAQFPDAPPPNQTLGLLASWFQNWGWLSLIMPILFTLLLFPTGQPPTPRWRWLIVLGVGVSVFIALAVTFSQQLGPLDGNWTLRNPIGFISREAFQSDLINIPTSVSVLLLTVLCAASQFVRFRRAGAVERLQIKWLFSAAALFTAVYAPGFFNESFQASVSLVWNLLFTLAILAIPSTIGIAVLRYRLYDIDIIIRKTLVYATLTALLALVYFGCVVLLQSLFEALTGQQSPIVIVVSTLVIAALFNPLRRRVQSVIDRRLYRRKYDAAQTLTAFAATARDETDLDALTNQLLSVVLETVQPTLVSLRLWEPPDSARRRDAPDQHAVES
jgi:hypothetical protein